jgi:hypothetical protein
MIVLVSVMTVATAQAQNKREARTVMRAANADYEDENFASAWQEYRRVLQLDPEQKDAPIKAAVAASSLSYPADSLFLLEDKLKKSKSPDALYYLARIRHQQGKFDDALALLDQYSKVKSGKRLRSDEEVAQQRSYNVNAKDLLSKPTAARIRNMGATINSPYADYVPVIMPDESAIYFTSRRENPANPKRNGDNRFFEDVYVSYKKNGGWTYAENIGWPINTETNDACVAISPDGQRMIIYRTSPDITSGDLYISRLGANGRWSVPEIMSKEINSEYVETSACFSTDTSEIYFSSNRPGGLGGKDLYRIKKLPDGKWSPPLNLGPNVNTPFDDDAPFLHPDGMTLYFSSKGHNSMGDFDVFKCIWDKFENKFTQAMNVGYPINDVGNDIFFVLSADAQRGYYSSARAENLGSTDLYEVDTRFEETDLQVRTGRIVLGTQYGRGRLTLTEKGTDIINGYYSSHPQTGKFILVLDPAKSYDVEIEADGFEPQTATLEPKAFDGTEDLKYILKAKGGR